MDNLWIQESWIEVRDDGDDEKRYGLGESGVYETWTDDKGQLYRSLQQEYGRCVSKVYVDVEDGPPKSIGWVFQKRRPYEDNPQKTYLQEVWVTLHTAPPTKTVEYHYA